MPKGKGYSLRNSPAKKMMKKKTGNLGMVNEKGTRVVGPVSFEIGSKSGGGGRKKY